MSGLLGNVTKSLDNTLTGGDKEEGQGGLLGSVTGVLGKTVDSAGNAVVKTVDSVGNVVYQTVDGAGNIVGKTTEGVGDAAGKTTEGGDVKDKASGTVGGATDK